jgi:hypothetical protein
MSHYAQVKNGIVQQVIVAEQNFIDLLPDAGDWVQTSYNTSRNQHRLGGTPLRGNYAGIGCVYDSEYDVFYPPWPGPGWYLDKSTWAWKPVPPYPEDGNAYHWDEHTQTWKQ